MNLNAAFDAPPEMSLCSVRCGELVRVSGIRSTPGTTQRLQEMGFCQDAEVCKVADGAALICKICNMRVVLSRELGAQILVQKLRKLPA